MSLLFAIDTPFFDANGAPLAFGTVYFGQPNQDAVTNPKVPYTDDTFGTPLSATQELTIGGKFAQEVWLNGDYSIVIKDADDVQVAEYRLVPDPEGGAAWGGITGTLSAQTDLQTALNAKMPLLTYTGNAGKLFRVNDAETAAELVQFGPPLSVDSVSASYTLSLAIWNQFKNITGSGTVDITIPLDSTLDLPIGYTHIVRPRNSFSGTCTWVKADVSMTLEAPDGGTLVCGPNMASAATKIAANTWVIYGVTEAV